MFFGGDFFCFVLCYGDRKKQKSGFFSSGCAALRGHPTENSLCNLTAERKTMRNHHQDGFYSDGGCGEERRGSDTITTHGLVCGSQIRRILMRCELRRGSRGRAESPDSPPPPRASVQIGPIPHREAQPSRCIDWAAVQVFGLRLLH